MKPPIPNLKSKIASAWPCLVAALLCLPAALPYLGGDLPRSNDTLTHLYRAVELDSLIRAGEFFPRWGPHLAHGLGYPIFNYFAHFTHYVIVAFHFLGLSFLNAVRATYVIGLVGSGLSAFVLARDLSTDPLSGSQAREGEGNLPGWAAAAAYAYSPYLLYTAHVRGGLPETVALAFVPLAFFGIRRALLAVSPRHKDAEPQRVVKETIGYGLVAVLAIAGFISSHIGMALQYLPLLGLWGLFCTAIVSKPDDRSSSSPPHPVILSSPHPVILSPSHPVTRSLLTLAALFSLALGLTAFIWLPAVTELQFVQFQTAFARSGAHYANNFSFVYELFNYPSLPVYVDVLNPPLVRPLPLAAIVIATLGLLRLRWLDPRARAEYSGLFALLVLGSFLAVDLSKPVWDAVALLQRSVLPWRFLGPASLFAAVLAGLALSRQPSALTPAPVAERNGGRPSSVVVVHCLIVSLFIASSAPFLFPPREPAPDNPSLADLARFEIPPLLVGTTTTGEYTPIWAQEFPDTAEMQAALIEGREPERLVAPGAMVEHLSARPAHDVFRIQSGEPITVTYRSFYFPGWQAGLDGEPIEIQITEPHGLMAFSLPAGEHTLDIRFGSTPVRTAAGLVSAVAWLITAGLGLRSVAGRQPSAVGRQPLVVSGLPSAVWVLSLGYCSLFIASLFIVRPGPPAVQHPLNLDFGGELTLVGYTQSKIQNQKSEIALVWQARHPLGVAYGFNLRLTDDNGLVWSDTNIERPPDWRFYPGTHTWTPEQFILDPYVLNPLRGAPPGRYRLDVIAYRIDTLQALAVHTIGEYAIEEPTNEPLARPLLTLDGVALLAIEADRAEAAPGDPYRLTLHWQAAADSPPEQDFELELLDSSGAVIYARTEPVAPNYSSHHWKAGDVYRQEVFFRLPAGLPGGGHHWRLAGAELPASAAVPLRLHTPTRSFDGPTLTHPRPVEILPSIRLLGYNLSTEGNAITIELAWQAVTEMSEPYRVFLHMLDADGNLVSQSDGEPANWTRPTTGWLPGEVVLDPRTLAAPGPGEYTLQAGLVTEAGERAAGPVDLGSIRLP